MNDQAQKIKVGISIGDFNGIGMEVILKTFLDKRMMEICTPIVFGSARTSAYHRQVSHRGAALSRRKTVQTPAQLPCPTPDCTPSGGFPSWDCTDHCHAKMGAAVQWYSLDDARSHQH